MVLVHYSRIIVLRVQLLFHRKDTLSDCVIGSHDRTLEKDHEFGLPREEERKFHDSDFKVHTRLEIVYMQ